MRFKIQELRGPTTNTPQATPVSTLAVTDPAARSTAAPVAPQLLDFSAIAPSLQKLNAEAKEFRDKGLTAAGVRVADLQQQYLEEFEGDKQKALAKALREVSSSNKTPRAIRNAIGRMADRGDVQVSDLPTFRLALESRQADVALDQYERSATANAQVYADRLAAAPLEGREAVLREILAEAREEFGTNLDSFGVFGTTRVAEKLLEVNRRIVREIDRFEGPAVQERYLHDMGEILKYRGQKILDADTTEEKLALLAEINLQAEEMRGDVGNKAAAAIVGRSIIGLANELEADKGPAAARAVLEFMFDNLKGFGDRSLLDGSSAEDSIMDALGTLEFRARQEAERQSQLQWRSKSNAANAFLTTDLYADAVAASSKGPAELRSYFQNLAAASHTKEFFEAHGIAPEHQPFFLASMREAERNLMTDAARLQAVDAEIVKGRLYQLYDELEDFQGPLQGSRLDLALDVVRGTEGLGGARAELEAFARKLYDENDPTSQLHARIRQEGIDGQVDRIVLESLQDPENPDVQPSPAEVASLTAAARREWITRLESFVAESGEGVTRTDILRFRDQTLGELRELFPPAGSSKAPQGTTTAELVSEVDKRRRQGSLEFSAGEIYKPDGDILFGGVAREGASSDLTALHRLAIEGVSDKLSFSQTPFTPAFGSPGVVPDPAGQAQQARERKRARFGRKILDEIDSIASSGDLPKSQKVEVASEALAISGLLTIDTAIALGNAEGSEEIDEAARGLRLELETVEGLGKLEYLGLADVNPYSFRIEEYRGAERYLTRQGVGFDRAIVVRPDIPEELLSKTQKLMEFFDLPTDPETTARFLAAQANNWTR